MPHTDIYLPQNDDPALIDWLKRDGFVERMAYVVERCPPPQVFGLHGDWGAGKTSAMHQLHKQLVGACPHSSQEDTQAKLNPKAKCQVVWFEAWRYEQEQMPVVALLHEIRSHFSFGRQMLDEAGKIATVTVRSLLDLDFVASLLGGVKAENVEKHGEKWEKERFASSLPTHLIRQYLQEAVRNLLGKNQRLVVLVDDLDRCDPHAAYKLLEGIKIYLNLANCVFVLGMNQSVIERAIAASLKDEKPEGVEGERLRTYRAREYLEKICQDLWHLPALSDPPAFLADCLNGNHVVASARFDLAPAFKEVAEKTKCLPPNPRKIKMLANVLRRYATHSVYTDRTNPKTSAYREDYLAMLAASLYCCHPEIYKRVELFPDFIIELVQWANGKKSQHDLLRALKLPEEVDTSSAQAATPGSERRVHTFLDPSRTDAFLLRLLIEKTPGGIVSKDFQAVLL